MPFQHNAFAVFGGQFAAEGADVFNYLGQLRPGVGKVGFSAEAHRLEGVAVVDASGQVLAFDLARKVLVVVVHYHDLVLFAIL